jgi:hypothetical protein
MQRRTLTLLVALVAAVAAATPAVADCTDDVCQSIQALLVARANNFAKLRGKPGVDPRGDAEWQGTQAIPGLIKYCFVYKRGEGAHYEYRCDSSNLGNDAPLRLEAARKIAATLKAAFQAADPKLVWFVDPAAADLATVEGFEGSETWYGGKARNKITAKVQIIGAGSGGHTVGISIFASDLSRRDVK